MARLDRPAGTSCAPVHRRLHRFHPGHDGVLAASQCRGGVAVWSAVGVTGVAVAGVFPYQDRMGGRAVAGIIPGVVVLVTSGHTRHS
jgi:hypothetical protein